MNVFSIAFHGGVGSLVKGMMTPELETSYKTALQLSLDKDYSILNNGGTATDAVKDAIAVLEDSPLFNAGTRKYFYRDRKS